MPLLVLTPIKEQHMSSTSSRFRRSVVMGDSGQLSMRAFSIALVTTIAISFLTPLINAQSA